MIFLVITNPSLKQFKEDAGIVIDKDPDCPNFTDPHFIPRRDRNYFICSYYSYFGTKYFAIAGNFFRLKGPAFTHVLGVKMAM
jgi:hypothetical protein